MDADAPQESIPELILDYRETGIALRSAIEREDLEHVEFLDRRISVQFDTLLDIAPKNGEDALALIGFLIDNIVQYGAETLLSDRIRAKILAVVAAGFGGKTDAADD